MASYNLTGWSLGRSLLIFGAFALLLVIFVTNLAPVYNQNDGVNLVKSSLKQCQCTRSSSRSKNANYKVTSNCDTYATLRGRGQKVVAYSFYGDSSKNTRVRTHYLDQIQDRASEVAAQYPGWLMRIYFSADDAFSQSALCDIWCKNDHVDLCDVSNLPDPVLGDLKTLQPIGK